MCHWQCQLGQRSHIFSNLLITTSASINSFIFITMKLIIIITFLLVAVAASMNTSVYASGLRLPSSQESEAAMATNNVTTIKTNVFDKCKDTAIKAVVVATANTKTSKAPRAKGSKAPVYTKGSKVVSKSSDDEDCRGAKAKSGKTCNSSSEPSTNPSEQPSLGPSSNPSMSTNPSEKTSLDPSTNMSKQPSLDPSSNPSEQPSLSSNPSVSTNPSVSATQYCFPDRAALKTAVNNYISQNCATNSTCATRTR